MIAFALSSEQSAAVDADLSLSLAVMGAPGTGKSTVLAERLARVRREHPHADPLVIDRNHSLDTYAATVLREAGITVQLLDDVEAELIFAGACAPLFTMNWEELANEELDPEVAGLRSPERFAESAFRLIRRLREANIDPQTFLARALAGAAEFHAKPPNLAHPSLLYATKEAYRDSLNVSASELQRQYRREVDLAKVLAKLYTGYIDLVESQGRMTGRDAVLAALRHVRAFPEIARRLRERHGFALIDDAQNLTGAQLELLQAIFGEHLTGVTVAGDPSSAVSPLQSGRPEAAFQLATARITLGKQFRSPLAVEIACHRLVVPHDRPGATNVEPALRVCRAKTQRDEAEYIAARVRAWLDDGVPADRIAVLMRSVRDIEAYESALLDRDVAVATSGDTNLFTDRRALDALALLWNVEDPFRHDWMLRTVGNPAIGLADASLALLCAEPPSPQAPLFVLDDEPAPTVRSSRWDPKRDLRLGWNVIRGEQDAALSSDARGRVERFRRLREGWLDAMQRLPFADFVRLVWSEGLAREGLPGSARARTQQVVLDRLLARLHGFFLAHPDATLSGVLEYAERRAQSDLESCEPFDGACFSATGIPGVVPILSIDAAAGHEFDRVVIANVRAGAFPRWYAPDAFLFSPRLGMIPKENTGEATASRTAKFTYYIFRNAARERYNDHERRALLYALRRARVSAIVTASETPTKGISAPEFLEELRGARLPGCEID